MGVNAGAGVSTDRRRLLRGSAAAGGLGLLGLGGCATAQGSGGLAPYDRVPRLAPVRPHTDRLFDITVCLRPFRAAGPRLDTEMLGDKLVVHNYGHGGSGWSLSWGSAQVALGKALSTGAGEIAVIGAGAIGMTTALTAQRAGARVTVYAKERTAQARSARATGSWTPDSRISKAADAGPQFAALWEQMARTSFKSWRAWLGLPGTPVEWNDRYNLSDLPPDEARAKRRAEDTMHFGEYADSIRDLTPRAVVLPPGSHPFPTAYATRNSSLMFNVTGLAHQMESDFLLAGGQFEMREFHAPSELMALPEKVIINCTGYGARALWKDESITPVRGQIAWLIPQPEVNYGLYYKNVSMLSRRDGIVIQATGSEESGWNDDHEVIDRAEADGAVRTIAEVYDRWPRRRG